MRKSYQRDINKGLVDEKLLSEIPVGIQKTLGYSNRFELIFEFNDEDDLYIVVDIINSDEICIITVIPKDKRRRQH